MTKPPSHLASRVCVCVVAKQAGKHRSTNSLPLSRIQQTTPIHRQPERRKRVLSGVQPTGSLHLGNYLGVRPVRIRVHADMGCGIAADELTLKHPLICMAGDPAVGEEPGGVRLLILRRRPPRHHGARNGRDRGSVCRRMLMMVYDCLASRWSCKGSVCDTMSMPIQSIPTVPH